MNVPKPLIRTYYLRSFPPINNKSTCSSSQHFLIYRLEFYLAFITKNTNENLRMSLIFNRYFMSSSAFEKYLPDFVILAE